MLYTNDDVRRQDRLLPESCAIGILDSGEYGFLSMVDMLPDGASGSCVAYGVPVSYVWNHGDGIYIHCAPEGRKLRSMSQHAQVSFCVVGATHVCASSFTTAYESIVLNCEASVCADDDERMRAIVMFLDKYAPHNAELGKTMAAKSMKRTCIIKLTIKRWSGKCKRVKE